MTNRTKELALIDSIERQLHKLSETSPYENMVKSLISQVQFLGQTYFVKKSETYIKDTDQMRAMAGRIVFLLESGRKLSSFDIGEEILPYIRRLKENGMTGIKSERKYLSKAKRILTYYYLEK